MLAEDDPLKATVAPFPPLPLIVPEIENVAGGMAVAVNAGTVTLAPLTVAFWLPAGLNVKPLCDSASRYRSRSLNQ